MSAGGAVAYYDALWTRTRRLDQHHKCRMAAIERVLRRLPPPPVPPRRILELGCGSGLVSALLARHGTVVGIDQSPVGVETARAAVAGRFMVGTLPAIDLPDRDFDLCVLSQVLEHLVSAEQEAVLRAAHARVRPGGALVVTTPNRPVSARMRFARGELQPIENWLDPAALERLLVRTGWRVVETRWAFAFLPVLASRVPALRALRFLAYDGLRLRAPVERLLARRPIGDTTVVWATR